MNNWERKNEQFGQEQNVGKKKKKTNDQMELPTECWRAVLDFTGMWDLGQLTKTSHFFHTACFEHFRENRASYFPVYNTDYNVSAWAVVKKHFLAAARGKTRVLKTLHGVVGYLYANRIYVYKDSFVYVPASEDPYLEGPLTMQVYVDSDDEETPYKINAPDTMPPISGSTMEALALRDSPAW